MSEDWKEWEIRDLISSHVSGPSPDCEERNISSSEEWGVLKTTAITWRGWDQYAHKVLPKAFWGQEHLAVRRDDVLVTKAGPRHRVAVSCHVDTAPERIIVSGKMIGLRPRKDLVSPLVLAGMIAQPSAQKYIQDRTTGMAESQVNFANKALLSTSIRLPDLPLQSKIAEVLDTLDAAIRGTEAVVAKLKAMKQGLLHDLLTRGIDANGDLRPPHTEAPHLYQETLLGWLPKEWDVVPLGEITRELTQGWSPDCPSEEALADEWGVLKTTAVVWQGYQAHENKRLPLVLKPRPHLQVEARDILITRAGPSSRVAVVAYVPETRDKLMISDKLYRLRVHQRHNPGYVSLALGSTAVQREISKTISGMAESQTNISQATLKPLPTPLPPQSEQEHIAETIGAQSRKIAEEEQLLEKLRLQKSGLMDDLLTGRVPVTPLLDWEAAHGA